ncbi:PDZ domain-containing protein [Rariglobus hedericola]|nr:PDZ domain-containing protein [Rariglobus hedericola]
MMKPIPLNFLRIAIVAFVACTASVMRAADDIPALFKERVKSVVAVEFFTESELDRRPTIVSALVADTAGTIVLPPTAINNFVQPSKLKDFRIYLPGRPASEYSSGEYLGQDPLSGWHFVRVEEKLRAQLVPVTAFAAAVDAGEPALGAEFWGIGLRGKDEDFAPYFLASRISHVQSMPERTAIALAEVASPGLPVFDRAGAFAGVAVGGFGQTYVQFSRNDRGLPVMLLNMEESSVFVLGSAIKSWLTRAPSTLSGRPIAWLGAYGLQPMDPEVASFLKLGDQSGCVVSEVLEGSPAEAAGLKNRDIILAIDGSALPRFKPDRVVVTYFDRELGKRKPGDTVALTVLRGSERVEIKATLVDQPKLFREADRTYFEKLGFTAREFVYGDGVVRRVKVDGQKGVIAQFVKNSGPAGTAGLRPDDWIIEVDGSEVKTYAEAVAKLAVIESDTNRTDFVLLTSRGGETAVLRVKLK